MRSRYIYIIGSRVCIMLAVLWLLACTSSDSDDPQPSIINNGCVAVDLALSVSATNSNTRMAYGVVKPTSLSGLSLNFSVLPFIIPSSQDTITTSNTPLAGPITSFSRDPNHYHYLSDQVDLTIGTNAFLCYANVDHGTIYDKSSNGYLKVEGTGLSTTFDWEHIQQASTDPNNPNADAVKILNCLNAIATVEYSNGLTWNNSEDEIIADLFNRFVNNSQSIAGSSRNIIAYVNYWYHEANTIADPLKTAIKNAISANFTVTGDDVKAINDITSYPAGLPDGNAVITWNKTLKKFEYDEIKWDATSNEYYHLPDNDKFVNYVYPAERYFYANSRIKTSTSSQKDNYTASRWAEKAETTDENGVLDYYDDANIVASTTRSVAIKNPLSYGVAALEIHIKANTSSEINYLRDANSEYTKQMVTLETGTFPLTAIIVGSQVKQNCFFEPVISDNKVEYLIYDTNVTACLGATNEETYSDPIYTLGMQTKDGESMKVVLEFENNSDKDFISEDGIIYRHTKFYMVASVVPPTNEGIGKRVMTRGHMTVVNLTIKSLKSAYNALPDLRSDKLRLFDVVEAGIRKWQTGQTGEHEFFNW